MASLHAKKGQVFINNTEYLIYNDDMQLSYIQHGIVDRNTAAKRCK